MAIFSFLGNLFSLITTALKGLALRWLYQRGVEKGLETAREADRKRAVAEANALAKLTEAHRKTDREVADEKARLDATDPVAGRVRGGTSPTWREPGDVAGPRDPGKSQ